MSGTVAHRRQDVSTLHSIAGIQYPSKLYKNGCGQPLLFSQTGNTVCISHFENFVVLIVFQLWLAWLTYNRNNNTNSLHFYLSDSRKANRVLWNGTVLTTVAHSSRLATISFAPTA